MCTVLGVLGTLVLVKMAARSLGWRRHGCGYDGGCGDHRVRWHRPRPWRRWRRGPIDLGELGHVDLGDTADGAIVDVSSRIDQALRGLELNARQAAEAGDVIAALRGAFGPARFAAASEVLLALRAAGKTPFDADLAEAALGPRLAGEAGREAREAIEHLHHILTEEQRATLLKTLPRTL